MTCTTTIYVDRLFKITFYCGFEDSFSLSFKTRCGKLANDASNAQNFGSTICVNEPVAVARRVSSPPPHYSNGNFG